MTTTIEHAAKEFETELRQLSKSLFPTRSLSVMNDGAVASWNLATKMEQYKEYCRIKNIEFGANLFLSAQCIASAVASEFEMWIRLRENDPHEAWNRLIDAQEYLAVSRRARSTTDSSALAERLEQHERNLFPPVVHVSAGFRYRSGACSICRERFDRCAHEEGMVYMGRLCREIELRDFELMEASIVEHPKDKRCRVAAFDDEQGHRRDWFTSELKPTTPQEDENKNPGGEIVIMTFDKLKNV